MPTLEIVRAWKDEEYRDTFTTEQRAQLPEHPSGVIEFEERGFEEDNSLRFVPAAGTWGNCLTHVGGCHKTLNTNCI
jgi:mersacidin/lichenicidin family type 2 lantibiotic